MYDIFLKKGENFHCWNCGKLIITNVRRDIYFNTTINDLVRFANVKTATSNRTTTISDGKSKCVYCKVYVYDMLKIRRKELLPDELFEL